MEPSTEKKKGAFIVIEGLDRSGKTTQVRRLCEKLRLQCRHVESIKFPDRTTPIGIMIDGYLQNSVSMDDRAIHLLFAANRWEKAQWITDTLAQGTTIVCDRYSYSGIVYSAAKHNPLLTLEWARASEVGLPHPDVVVFLDVPPHCAAQRAGYGVERYEKKEFQQRVRALFLQLFVLVAGPTNVKIIGGDYSEDVIERQVLAAVEAFLPDQ